MLRDRQFLTLLTCDCASPKRRAPSRHLNFQKVLQTWGVLRIVTSKCASRHNCLHFLNIATQKCSECGALCTFWLHATTKGNFSSLWWDGSRRFSEPPEPQNMFATFLPFHAPASSFYWLFLILSLLWLFPPLLFQLSTSSEVWLPNFLRIATRFYWFVWEKCVRTSSNYMGKTPCMPHM